MIFISASRASTQRAPAERNLLWFTEVAEADTHEPEPLLGA